MRQRPNLYRFVDNYPLYQLIYDTVWTIALAIQKCLSEGVALTVYRIKNGGLLLRRFTSGLQLMDNIKESYFKGLSGRVRFNRDGTRRTWY